MSEHTPTTGQVRRYWVREWAPSPELEAQFDRWLAAELRKAKAEALRDLAKDTDALEAAEAKIAAVRDLHRKFTYYDLEDSCENVSDEHREEHHHESEDIGEFYCDMLPTGDVRCVGCCTPDGERMEWPCPTIEALEGSMNESQ